MSQVLSSGYIMVDHDFGGIVVVWKDGIKNVVGSSAMIFS